MRALRALSVLAKPAGWAEHALVLVGIDIKPCRKLCMQTDCGAVLGIGVENLAPIQRAWTLLKIFPVGTFPAL